MDSTDQGETATGRHKLLTKNGAEQKRLQVRTCTQECACTCQSPIPLAPSGKLAAHTPPAKHQPSNRIKNTMRHLPANMVNSKCNTGTETQTR